MSPPRVVSPLCTSYYPCKASWKENFWTWRLIFYAVLYLNSNTDTNVLFVCVHNVLRIHCFGWSADSLRTDVFFLEKTAAFSSTTDVCVLYIARWAFTDDCSINNERTISGFEYYYRPMTLKVTIKINCRSRFCSIQSFQLVCALL